MTIVDQNVEYRPLLMIIGRKVCTHEVPLDPAYQYVAYQPAFETAWAQLQYDLGVFDTLDKAQQTIHEMASKPMFKENFLFVCDQNGHLVGSAGLWPGHHYGMERLRIHYVAVSQAHQHHKIGSSMVSKLVMKYDATPGKYPLYLATQTNSYGAIAMYSHLGFTAYLGAYEGCTKKQSEANWTLATQILREKSASSF
ncbi:MAG: GNAT family N-acetyltransferase [Absicoccus porci]|jgi:ribosomal protein S18 acetylase RimI-like enzyme|uniref:GNAT family N-acetyltransferase n=1 Tax=Absicoccus porci TaxID=2486576 RepID=UPI00240A0DC9|nr:GNAT family N-acetyltransferase [Absicoccus porci]MDD6460061.1 GNAT family N-acetyltransferase [Absicoccus porci]